MHNAYTYSQMAVECAVQPSGSLQCRLRHKHTDVDIHTDIRHGPAQENKDETSFGELRELC